MAAAAAAAGTVEAMVITMAATHEEIRTSLMAETAIGAKDGQLALAPPLLLALLPPRRPAPPTTLRSTPSTTVVKIRTPHMAAMQRMSNTTNSTMLQPRPSNRLNKDPRRHLHRDRLPHPQLNRLLRRRLPVTRPRLPLLGLRLPRRALPPLPGPTAATVRYVTVP